MNQTKTQTEQEKRQWLKGTVLQDAEECKQELSNCSKSGIFVSFDAESKEVVITRETFDKLIRKMYGKTESAVLLWFA